MLRMVIRKAGMHANSGWKPGHLSTGGRQSSQEQWTKETARDSKSKEISNVLWHKSCKEDQKRERTQGSKDESDRTALVSGLRRLKHFRDEEEKLDEER